MQTILILEDEADIRELLAISLSNPKVRCELCSHLSDALSVLSQCKPDFVLTDLHLPDGNGLELLKETRRRYPDVAVAVITAFADTDSAIEALKLGAVDYLKKPIDTTALRLLVTQQLNRPASTPEPSVSSSPEEPTGEDEGASIKKALEHHRWNKRAAAQALGLSYRQLRYRISKLGLE